MTSALRLLCIVTAACSTGHTPSRVATPPARRSFVEADPQLAFPEQAPFRLPHSFEPTGYRAQITLGTDRFTGHIEITGELVEPVTLIWLHGVELDVTSASAIRGAQTVTLRASPPRKDEVLGFATKTPLDAGTWTLVIDYVGKIHDLQPPVDDGHGHLRDPFPMGIFRRAVGANTYVFTQSEAIYARRIFPCIDEPDRKVPWQLTLDVAKDMLAASNTPIEHETVVGDRKRVEFGRTLPLPSYLIAFAVGPFDVVPVPSTKSGVPIRVLETKGHRGNVPRIVEAAPKILEGLEEWLGVPYAYGKLDIVAVPHLGLGAMENAGLITCTQDWLESEGGPDALGHELAHQWFGNLVTFRWWDDIWLAESFANLLAGRFEPNGEPFDIAAERVTALRGLAPGFTRQTVTSNESLEGAAFGPFSAMWRGRALLSLVEAQLGETAFRTALRAYLVGHAHGTATTEDLFAALQAQSRSPIDKELTWFLEREAPTFKTETVCDGNPRLVVTGAPVEMPFCVAFDRDGARGDVCTTVEPDAPTELPIHVKRCPRWIFPNAGATGAYAIHWQPLLPALLHEGWNNLTAPEREMLFAELDEPADQLAVYVKLAATGRPSRLFQERAFLQELTRYVPDDLRERLARWTGPTVTAPPATPPPTRAELVELLESKAKLSGDARYRMITGLAELPDVLEVFEEAPDRIDQVRSWEARQLFHQVCDTKTRDRLRKLVRPKSNIGNALLEVDRCIAVRARMEPLFRAWLKP
jgi:alanyl aminopeptidase